MVQVKKDSAEAAIIEEKVSKESAVVAEATKAANAIAVDAQADLDLAMPAFAASVKALKSLNKNDITELKGFAKPPPMVQTTLEAVLILKEIKPDWDNAKKEMNKSDFLESLETFDKDNIPAKAIKKLKKYVENPDFVPEKVERVSKAAKSLCMWVHAMDVYNKVAKNVEPKKLALAKSQAEVAEMTKILDVKQGELKAVQTKVAELNAQFNAAEQKKADLEAQANDTKVRLGLRSDMRALIM